MALRMAWSCLVDIESKMSLVTAFEATTLAEEMQHQRGAQYGFMDRILDALFMKSVA